MTRAQHLPGKRSDDRRQAPNRQDGTLPDETVGRDGWRPCLGALPRVAAHLLIRAYQLGLSGLVGRQCRHLPTCSHYTDEAIARHGLWAGGWIGLARICRCHPWGSAGFDPVPGSLPPEARWYAPWRYGQWRMRRTFEQDANGQW